MNKEELKKQLAILSETELAEILESVKISKEKETINFLISQRFYVHIGKETNRQTGKDWGLNEEQLQNFQYTGYEVALDIEIDETGTAYATHVNDVAIVTPVKV